MRRKLITMLVAALLLGAVSAAEQVMVNRITHEALNSTQEILSDIRAGRFDAAMEKSHALDKAWDEKAKLLEILVDHSSTDEVRYALSRLLAALECDDRAAAMIYACELEGGVEHVHERQAFTLENLL